MSTLSSLLLLACTEVVEPASDAILLTDANNYAYQGSIAVPSVDTRSGSDLTIDWSTLTADLQCHALDAADDVDNVALISFPNLDRDAVAQGLSDDSLKQADMGGYVSWENADAATQTRLTDLTFFGTDADIETLYTEGSGTWLLLLSTGTQIGVGTRMLGFLNPLEASTNDRVDVVDDCDMLDFAADLDSATPVGVPVGTAPTIDWSGLTVDGRGNPADLGKLDSVMIAHYASLSVADLEASFLDIELLADASWNVALAGGQQADLAAAVGADGAAFGGFTADGTWLLALRCSACSNPAPVFLAVVSPQ